MIEKIADFALAHPWAFAVIAISIGVGATYLFALAGSPQQLWFWRDIVGVL